MIITVNVPLGRFEELESAEAALQKILKDETKYVAYYVWGDWYYLPTADELFKQVFKDLKESNERRDQLVEEVRAWELKNNKKVVADYGKYY